ncbi:ADP-ribosylation factor [Entamoeba marina]
MGNILDSFTNQNLTRIIVFGLENSGKTTIIQQLLSYEPVNIIPTMGNVLESYIFKNYEFNIIENYSDKLQVLLRHYYTSAKAMIFVIDSNDLEQLEYSKTILTRLLEEENLTNKPLLLFANKNDLPNAINVDDINNYFSLFNIKSRKWYCQPSCATSNIGLEQGFNWLFDLLENSN